MGFYSFGDYRRCSRRLPRLYVSGTATIY